MNKNVIGRRRTERHAKGRACLVQWLVECFWRGGCGSVQNNNTETLFRIDERPPNSRLGEGGEQEGKQNFLLRLNREKTAIYVLDD